MNTTLRFDLLIPISLLVLQTLILIFLSFNVLKRFKILRTSYSGMEYSQLIVAVAILFGVLFISMSDIAALFQSFKTYQNTKENIFSGTFLKFSQFFMLVLFFEILFGLLCAFIIKLLLGFKNSLKEIEEGNLPAAILMSVIIIGMSMVLQLCAKEIIGYIIPQYLNFR